MVFCVNYIERRDKKGKTLGYMKFSFRNKEPYIQITFTDKSKMLLGPGFVADACEEYLLKLIEKGLKDVPKKDRPKSKQK